MRLIPNFQELLLSDHSEKLPATFSSWWEFDDADRFFQQEYEAQFGWEPHYTYDGKIIFEVWTFDNNMREIKKNLGCNRSTPTKKQIELQKIFYQQYDLKLIDHMRCLKQELDRYRSSLIEVQRYRECFADGITGNDLDYAYEEWAYVQEEKD